MSSAEMGKRLLTDQKLRIKINDQCSNFQELENGSPQGAVLSLMLFNVIADSLKQNLEDILIKYKVKLFETEILLGNPKSENGCSQ